MDDSPQTGQMLLDLLAEVSPSEHLHLHRAKNVMYIHTVPDPPGVRLDERLYQDLLALAEAELGQMVSSGTSLNNHPILAPRCITDQLFSLYNEGTRVFVTTNARLQAFLRPWVTRRKLRLLLGES